MRTAEEYLMKRQSGVGLTPYENGGKSSIVLGIQRENVEPVAISVPVVVLSPYTKIQALSGPFLDPIFGFEDSS